MIETRERILDAAERLFGEYGYAATSLRQIISEAEVNLGAVHYYFRSKQNLLDQVVLRKAVPLNEQRLVLLDRFEAEARPGPACVEKVLEAFIAPAVLIEKSPEFLKLMGRIYAEALMQSIARRHFQSMIDRFLSALRLALPHTTAEELAWKTHFMLGAMAHTLVVWPDRCPVGSDTPARRTKRLVAFVSGGFRTPVELED